MLAAALSLCVLAAAPSTIELASIGFHGVNIKPELAGFYADNFALKLSEQPGIHVSTARDIAAALGVERQKQLMGCADNSNSCLAELAGALGADGLVTGQLAKVGKVFQLDIKVLDTNARPLFLFSRRVSSEEAILDELEKGAEAAAKKLRETVKKVQPALVAPVEPVAPKPVEPAPAVAQAVAPPVTEPTAAELAQANEKPLRWQPFIPIGLGVIAAGVGAGAWIRAGGLYQELRAAEPGAVTAARALELKNSGETMQTMGIVMTAAGAAAAVGGLVWLLLGGDETPAAVSWSVGPTGVFVNGAW